MRIAKSLSVLAGLVISAAAGAVTWETGSPPTINPINTTTSIYCGEAVSGSSTCNTTGLSGNVIKMMAYSTPTKNTSGMNSPVDTGNWVNAQIAMYSGGVGITNVVQTFSSSGTPSVASEGTGSPQHAIDNRGANDVLVIDFGSDNWDVSSFSLGYTCQFLEAASSDTNTSCIDGNVNADAWLGGTGSINFNQVAFNANNTAVPVAPAGFGTFTQLVLSPDVSGTGTRTNSNTGTGNTGSVTGRYLIIAGALTGYKDAFKVSGISADQVPPPPGGHQVPLPGSAPLVGLGLLALTWVSRRRVATAR